MGVLCGEAENVEVEGDVFAGGRKNQHSKVRMVRGMAVPKVVWSAIMSVEVSGEWIEEMILPQN